MKQMSLFRLKQLRPTNQDLTEDDWRKIFSLSWNNRQLQLLRRFRKTSNNKGGGIAMSNTSNENQKFSKARMPYRIRRLRPGKYGDPLRIYK